MDPKELDLFHLVKYYTSNSRKIHTYSNECEIAASVIEIPEKYDVQTTESDVFTITADSISSTENMALEDPTTPKPTEVIDSTNVNTNLQSNVDYYYGGSPNPSADYVYLTTLGPLPKYTLDTSTAVNDLEDFRPSIQHESYHYSINRHFVPIIITEQSKKFQSQLL